MKSQHDLVPGHPGRLGVNTKLDATYSDEVKAANTVDALTQANACWVQTPSFSLAGVVSSLLGKEFAHRPDLPSVSLEISPQRPTGDTAVVSHARFLFTFVVVYRPFHEASLIVGAMLLNLL